jgi:sugar (pentulose or hexulose) kinase
VVQHARTLVGAAAPRRAGCRLATGYLAVTLFWLKQHGLLPSGKACMLMDYAGAVLTGRAPVTDPSCAASAGVLDVARADWDAEALAALALPRELFVEVVPSGTPLGGLTAALAQRTRLPAGLPVFAGIGDNQASFLGSVARPEGAVLVNVGTGGQVNVHACVFDCDPPAVEARPFPGGSYLLVSAGLSGGAAYAVLERFMREVGREVFGVPGDLPVYDILNRLAEAVPPGSGGLRCEPFFLGTRVDPALRGTLTGASTSNLTPGHLARAVLEGMARTFAAGAARLAGMLGRTPEQLVGSGNGVRANPLLARLIAEGIGLPMQVPAHREEAAFGAALLAAAGAGIVPLPDAAGRWVRYGDQEEVSHR